MTRRAVNDNSGRGINVAPSVTRRQRVPVRLLRPALLFRIAFGLYDECRLSVFMAITGVFTPVLAKHSKSFSLIDSISLGSVECRETLSQCKNRSKPGREAKSPTVAAKMVIYEAFVGGKFEAPKHLARTVNDSTLSRSTRNSGRG